MNKFKIELSQYLKKNKTMDNNDILDMFGIPNKNGQIDK